MLYRFSITPEVFEHWAINDMNPAGVVLTELLKGTCENGLLANLNSGQWMTTVRHNQSDAAIPPAVRDRVETCLALLHDRNRLIRCPAGSAGFENDEYRWLRWSLERHRITPFAGIFASVEFIELLGIDDEILIRLSIALEAPCWTERKRSVRFDKTEANLRNHIKPLLSHAQRVTLIDPYMTCREDRFFNTVQHCADLLGKRDGTQFPGLIDVHTGDPETVGPAQYHESKEHRLQRWTDSLKQVVQQWGHRYRVFLWKNKPRGKTFHDRYIITDQCGIDAPGGLDFASDDEQARANITSWSMLETAQTREIILDEFHHQKSPYTYLGSISVDP